MSAHVGFLRPARCRCTAVYGSQGRHLHGAWCLLLSHPTKQHWGPHARKCSHVYTAYNQRIKTRGFEPCSHLKDARYSFYACTCCTGTTTTHVLMKTHPFKVCGILVCVYMHLKTAKDEQGACAGCRLGCSQLTMAYHTELNFLAVMFALVIFPLNDLFSTSIAIIARPQTGATNLAGATRVRALEPGLNTLRVEQPTTSLIRHWLPYKLRVAYEAMGRPCSLPIIDKHLMSVVFPLMYVASVALSSIWAACWPHGSVPSSGCTVSAVVGRAVVRMGLTHSALPHMAFILSQQAARLPWNMLCAALGQPVCQGVKPHACSPTQRADDVGAWMGRPVLASATFLFCVSPVVGWLMQVATVLLVKVGSIAC